MKKLLKGLIISILLIFVGTTVQAQAPYIHSIGVVAGMTDGASYKAFVLGDRLALQADLGVHLGMKNSWNFWSLDLNPNIMYQRKISNTGLYWFAGGGLSLGYIFSEHLDFGRFGVNAIGGLEYKFNIPLALQFDFRPGYGLRFREHFNDSYFDWGLNLSARYTF